MGGLDTLVHVANGLYENCKEDEAHDLLNFQFIENHDDQQVVYSKTNQGL